MSLPASGRADEVAAGELEADVFQQRLALCVARVATPKRARVVASLFRPRAVLEALDRVVEDVGMAPPWARVSAEQPLFALEGAPTLRGEGKKVVRLGNRYRGFGVARTLKLQAGPKVAASLQPADDVVPHRNTPVRVGVPNDVPCRAAPAIIGR